MIDYFAIGLTHGLLMLAFLRMLGRDDLDSDPESGEGDYGDGDGDGISGKARRAADPVYRSGISAQPHSPNSEG